MPTVYKVINLIINILHLPIVESESHLEEYTSAPASFETMISTYLSDGWVLAGGICVTNLNNNMICFSQSMSKTT